MRRRQPKPFRRLCLMAHALDMTQDDMAHAAGITTVTLRSRLYGEKPFTLDEAYGIADAMGIPDTQLSEYFPDRRHGHA